MYIHMIIYIYDYMIIPTHPPTHPPTHTHTHTYIKRETRTLRSTSALIYIYA